MSLNNPFCLLFSFYSFCFYKWVFFALASLLVVGQFGTHDVQGGNMKFNWSQKSHHVIVSQLDHAKRFGLFLLLLSFCGALIARLLKDTLNK